jgi:hypothetical protein
VGNELRDPFSRQPLLEVRFVTGLGAAFFTGRFLGGGGGLGFEGPFGRRRLETVFEVAELGFEFEKTRFENPAIGTVRERITGRGFHPTTMTDSKGKRKTCSRTVNGYLHS